MSPGAGPPGPASARRASHAAAPAYSSYPHCPMQITGFRVAVHPGIESPPTLTLWLDKHTTIWRLLEGTLDGMTAFMAGQYRADGNIVLSQLLLYLFQSPQALLAHEIKD